MSENNDIKILNNYIGFGRIDAKYNFFAIEENIGNDNSVIEYYEFLLNKYNDTYYSVTLENLEEEFYKNSKKENEYIAYKNRANNNSLYSCISLIYNSFNKETKIKNEELGSDKYNLLFGNFYPIGKPNTSECEYPSKLQEKFNIKCIREYDNLYKDDRINIFRDYINKLKNSSEDKFVFTFGFTQIDYKEFFEKTLNIKLELKHFFEDKSKKNNNYWEGKINRLNIQCFYHTGKGHLKIEFLKKIFNDNLN